MSKFNMFITAVCVLFKTPKTHAKTWKLRRLKNYAEILVMSSLKTKQLYFSLSFGPDNNERLASEK